MPAYQIKGADKTTGKERSIRLDAEDEKSAALAASEQNLFVSAIEVDKPKESVNAFLFPNLYEGPREPQRLDENDPIILFDLGRKPKAGDTERYLLGIGFLLRKIHFWILFWSVASLLGSIISIIAVIIVASQK